MKVSIFRISSLSVVVFPFCYGDQFVLLIFFYQCSFCLVHVSFAACFQFVSLLLFFYVFFVDCKHFVLLLCSFYISSAELLEVAICCFNFRVCFICHLQSGQCSGFIIIKFGFFRCTFLDRKIFIYLLSVLSRLLLFAFVICIIFIFFEFFFLFSL